MSKSLAILGSTGSIGVNTLDVIRKKTDEFSIISLAALQNVEILAAQAREFKPKFVAIADETKVQELVSLLNGLDIEIGGGEQAVVEAAVSDQAEMVVAAIAGSSGLLPTYSAVEAGKNVALANKETLVMAGDLIMEMIRQNGSVILPIDSEHSALFQSLQAGRSDDVQRFILTASGGPFYNLDVKEFGDITPAQALKHPRWSMGAKVTIDSATFANKGLEVIEASKLFGLEDSKIDVVVHPEAIVHSMVEFKDFSIIAQMSVTDMRLPIQYALTWPERNPSPVERLSFNKEMNLCFLPRRDSAFPALPLAFEALKIGSYGTIAYNAADEVAVKGFLEKKLSFMDISRVIEGVLSDIGKGDASSIDEVLEVNAEAAARAESIAKDLQ